MNQNFKSCIEYETTFEALDKENCYDTISQVKIKRIDLDQMTKIIYKAVEPENNLYNPVVWETFSVLEDVQKKTIGKNILIHMYCIHRLLVLNHVYNPEFWRYHIGTDYYGEEVSEFRLVPEVLELMNIELSWLHGKSNAKRIEYVLEKEYGHLIDSVRNQDWDVIITDIGKILFSNEKYRQKCLSEQFDFHSDLPKGICIFRPETGKYRVVDGYHRIIGARDSKFTIIYARARD